MGTIRIPDDVVVYFRKTGAMGGKARAERHTPEELSAWGKKGGRPKGRGKKPPTKAATGGKAGSRAKGGK